MVHITRVLYRIQCIILPPQPEKVHSVMYGLHSQWNVSKFIQQQPDGAIGRWEWWPWRNHRYHFLHYDRPDDCVRRKSTTLPLRPYWIFIMFFFFLFIARFQWVRFFWVMRRSIRVSTWLLCLRDLKPHYVKSYLNKLSSRYEIEWVIKIGFRFLHLKKSVTLKNLRVKIS